MYKYGDKVKIKDSESFYNGADVYITSVGEKINEDDSVGYVYRCTVPIKNTGFYKELTFEDNQLEELGV